MSYRLVAAPATEPVSLADLKAHLRIEDTLSDAQLLSLIVVARATVERITRRFLITQTWCVVRDDYPADGLLDLPIGPVLSVSALRVGNANGSWTVWPGSTMTLDLTSDPARLLLSGSQPIPGRVIGGIEIDVVVGYGAAASNIPPMLVQAVKLLAAHWYESRGDRTATEIPVDVAELIGGYRVRRLAA